jgi:tetratricopeptide (TPR) repeat protein
MDISPPSFATTRGRLLLRDSVAFLALLGITLALFGVTLFLFRSFERRRVEIAQRWSERGQAALGQGDPTYAVFALRTALSYQPNDRDAQLALAQALVASGRTDEAMNYFLNLWDVHPGDGFVNLELARLSRKKGRVDDAVTYYRAAIFGSWNADGIERRRETRFELADYYISNGNYGQARSVLLTASGNTPEAAPIQLELAKRLQAIGDLKDALATYQKLLRFEPENRDALGLAGRTAYALADYPLAATLLNQALETSAKNPSGADQDIPELQRLDADARRMQELNLSRDLPAQDRAAHLVLASGIAQRRLQQCIGHPAFTGSALTTAQPGAVSSAPAPPAPLATLDQRWLEEEKYVSRSTLQHEADAADSLAVLIHDTELGTLPFCTAPTGDDALLVRLASPPAGAAH